MPTLDAESIDAVVCDPPYALTANKRGGSGLASVNLESPYGRARIGTGNGGGFMGKEWDAALPTVEMWAEALRVAKPGAHLLAFGGTRTFHRLTCAIEDAGWEIRDCLSWLYGSGFPKSHNGAWGGTALKPAWEPVILARKPLIGTVEANHAAHGTGALNIDGCRIATTDTYSYPNGPGGNVNPTSLGARKDGTSSLRRETPVESHPLGRWPANVALDEEAARALDEQSGERASGKMEPTHTNAGRAIYGQNAPGGFVTMETYGDSGGASRFFYTAKASRSEREAGLRKAGLREVRVVASVHGNGTLGVEKNPNHPRANIHPTVKPVDLMRWLVRLVTPLGGTVLDPFLGSGTTGVAALQEGCRFIGIEREAQYVEIAKARIAHEAAQGSLFV
jgi:site-specific DNA-methyltransferase (adenine-specific)